MRQRRAAAALPAILGLLILLSAARAAPLPNATSRTLQPPWNLVAAPESTTIDGLVAGKPEVDAVFRWNAEAQRFDSWRRDAPALLNTLSGVDRGDGIWVLVSEAVDWTQPALGPSPVPAATAGGGWLLVGWTDADSSAAEVVTLLGAQRLVGFDAGGQRFRSFDPSVPAVLNSLDSVRHGDAVWAFFGRGFGEADLTPAFGGRGFESAIEVGAYPGGLFFVADLGGVVELMDVNGAGRGRLLDLRSRTRSGGEEGLLSVALDPDFEANGYLYAYYTPAGGEQTRLSRFSVSNGQASLGSELVIIEIEQPFANHNGGAVRFGPEAMLYLGIGDGGSGGDPLGHGQNPQSLLGTIIRIDVRDASAAQPYAVPADNPFVGGGGRAEVWAYGLRNPWRMAFDAASGALWVGDVGQNAVEEINVIERGGNYGWNRFEGNDCFDAGQGCEASGLEAPLATYRHGEGCSVTGGVVAGAGAGAGLAGAYVYGDFCSGRIWAVDGEAPGTPVQIASADGNISSFALGADGSVYVVLFDGPVLRLSLP